MKLNKVLIALLLTVSAFAADIYPSSHAVLTPKVGAGTTFDDPVIPMVILGDGWTERFVLQNVDSKWSSAGTISFFSADGTPLSVNLKDRGAFTAFDFNIPSGNTLMIETVPTNGAQRLGWALVQQRGTSSVSNDYSGIGDMFGQIIFRKSTPGLPDFMCSIVLGAHAYTKLTTFFDNTGGNYTGMGVVTSNSFRGTGTVDLRVTVRDISGSVVSQKIITRGQRTLYWMNLGVDFPETNGRMGTFEVEAVTTYSTTLTGMSLQFSGNAFTSITPFEGLF